MKQSSSKVQNPIDIAWLAGLLDGEGCIAFARRSDYNPHRLLQLRYDMKLAMACRPTIERAYSIIVTIIDESYVLGPFEERRKIARRRPLWRVEVGSKRGVSELLSAVEPYLFTKQLEARLCLRYLSRAIKSKHYQPTPYDRRLAELATALRNGCGEARLEAKELLEQVIPSQSVQGALFGENFTAGVETSELSPNDNARQECPAPDSPSAKGEEIVRSREETLGGDLNGHQSRKN